MLAKELRSSLDTNFIFILSRSPSVPSPTEINLVPPSSSTYLYRCRTEVDLSSQRQLRAEFYHHSTNQINLINALCVYFQTNMKHFGFFLVL